MSQSKSIIKERQREVRLFERFNIRRLLNQERAFRHKLIKRRKR